VVLVVLALVVGLTSCSQISSTLDAPASVTYRVYGQAAANLTIRVVTELEGVRTFAAVTPGELPWEYQTGYAGGVRYYLQIDVPAVSLASGTTAVPADTDILYDPSAAFTATVQQNDLVRNTSASAFTIVTRVIDDNTLQVGREHWFAAGTSYRVYARNSLGAMMIVHHADGSETVHAGNREAPEIDALRVDAHSPPTSVVGPAAAGTRGRQPTLP
jgi:hypothetical protein